MKQLFDELSLTVSRLVTKSYSTSFSLGIYFLSPQIRDAIYSVYGYVRVADEIVDSFEGYDKRKLLQRFREDTFEAIENRISVNPVLNSFQKAVHEYSIDTQLIEVFLHSMEMDLEKIDYTRESYNEYIIGSAEVVGLMCLHVFTNGESEEFARLKPYAMRLGAAFQKVNFLRDLREDYEELGRCYFPGVDLRDFSCEAKEQIEREIEEDFKFALTGIKKLPASCKGGVYLAYVYYNSLFQKIKKLPAKRIMAERVRINNGRKLGLMINSMVVHKMRLI
jgi:phytoene synthase